MANNVVMINIGQAGVQMGNAIWELFCMEHCITPDGECVSEIIDTTMNNFYQEVKDGKYIPRVIYIDSESSVIDEIRTGAYRELYHPNQFVIGKEDAANNFARGSFLTGANLIHEFRLNLEKLIEQTDNIESILYFNSIGGGSGSGTGALFLQQLMIDFPKVCKFQMPVNPGPVMSTSIVEPYNASFHIHTTMETVDLSVMVDNDALYHMCQTLLLISNPSYNDVNRLISLMISCITCSMRFRSSIHTGIREMYINLIPYPRIRFAIAAHSPILQQVRNIYSSISLEQMTKEVFSKSHQSVICNSYRSKYIAVILNYRGSVSAHEVSQVAYKYRKSSMKFVEWCPTGFKMCVNYTTPIVIPNSEIAHSDKSVTMLYNSTSVKDVWERITRKFVMLYNKRAFIHWYLNEGLEESEFGDALLNIDLLSEDYKEISLNYLELSDTMKIDPSQSTRSLTT